MVNLSHTRMHLCATHSDATLKEILSQAKGKECLVSRVAALHGARASFNTGQHQVETYATSRHAPCESTGHDWGAHVLAGVWWHRLRPRATRG